MKLLPVLLLSALLAPAPAGSAPTCSATLTLPDSGLDLSVRWRQLPADVAPFLEAEELDAWGLKALRVRSLLAQGAELDNDVSLRAGETLLPAGRWKLGFTVARGGAPRFFVVVGQDALPLPARDVEPGFESRTLLLQWVWIDRAQVQLHWHLGAKAGAIDLALGAEGTRDQRRAPPPPEPEGAAPQDDAPPRDG